MPEVEHVEIVNAPISFVWDFVKDMGNWVQYLKGYQKHEVKNEKDSVWWIKGDVGIMARTVSFAVHIDEWLPEDRATFSMKGISEVMDGGGALIMGPNVPGEETAAGKKGGLFKKKKKESAAAQPAPQAVAGADPNTTKLTFRLRINAGGLIGPMVNAVLGPVLKPIAEDFSTKLKARIEELYRTGK
ncbi:MAG: SRPBCC family protein [Chloroflexi bacterium]|nr:SRPBCC family protein [Chloroflexota bacterium]